MGLKIGNIQMPYGLLLAPMAGVTDRTFRRICREEGAEYTVSEMVSAKALCYEQKAKRKEFNISVSGELATIFEADAPMAIQIFGAEPEFMAQAAKLLECGSYKGCVSTVPPAAIDINMGCPVRKITSNGEGSALMKDPVLAEAIASAVCKAVEIPVTAKIRAGWDKNSVNAVEIAKRLENAGVAAICVHARTREQQYMPGIDMDIITKVKNAVSVPVIGNGDIYNADDAEKMFRETGCDGIMIGRGATGNPWIFAEIKARLEGSEYIPPNVEKRLETAVRQLDLMIEHHGERAGIAQAKKHMAWYLFGMRNSAAARSNVMTAENRDEIIAIFQEIKEMQQ